MFGLEGDEIIVHCLDCGRKDIMAWNPNKTLSITTYLHSPLPAQILGGMGGKWDIMYFFV